MTLKCDEKFEEKLPLGSRNNMRNLVNFNGSGGKSEDFPFDVLFLSKVFYVLVKKKCVITLRVITLKTIKWCKIWRGTDLCFEKWHEEFGEFWSNSRKSQHLHINGLLMTKVYNVWAKQLKRSYVSWHWRMMQYLKKKLTSGLKNDIRNLVNFHASSHKSECALWWACFVQSI